VLERTTAIARASGLSKEQAEGFVAHLDAEAGHMHESFTKSALDAQAKQAEAWGKALQDDPALGATPVERTAAIERSRQVLAKIDPDGELSKYLTETKQASNPAIVRTLARLSKMVGEGRFVQPTANTGELTADERLAKRYPTMAPK
jgi:hypothetical protein